MKSNDTALELGYLHKVMRVCIAPLGTHREFSMESLRLALSPFLSFSPVERLFVRY